MLPAGVSIRMLAWPVPVIRTAFLLDVVPLVPATTLPDGPATVGSGAACQTLPGSLDSLERTRRGRARTSDLPRPAQAGASAGGPFRCGRHGAAAARHAGRQPPGPGRRH